MPTIALRNHQGIYWTNSGPVAVHDDPFPPSNLFKRYRHLPVTRFKPENIYLYAGSYVFMNFWERHATLQPQREYYGATLKYADVYYNRFDNNIPLVCVLYFNNNKPPIIYKNSEHVSLINRNASAPIGGLSRFKQRDHQKELLELLIEENLKSLNSVTYELDKTNPGPGETPYNSGKITLSSRQIVRDHSLTQFYMHTHKPKNSTPKKSFLLINNKVPMSSKDKPVRFIQGDEYDSVNVYYNASDQIPIMIELLTKREKRHLHRFTTDGLRWSRNDISDSREDALLKYLKFTTKFVEEKKQEERQKLERERSRRRETDRGRERTQERDRVQERERGPEISQETQRTEDQRLQTEQRQHEITDLKISRTEEEVQADQAVTRSQSHKPSLTGQMCVLINKQTEYKSTEIEEICKNERSLKNETQPIDVQPETISVLPIDLRDDIGYETGYKYCIHLLKPNLNKLNGKGKEQQIEIELKIYISNIEIFLFDTRGLKTKLFANRGISENSIYVYFYEHNTRDPKLDAVPLMIQHNGKFYGPKNRDEYFTGWNRIDRISNPEIQFKIKSQLDSIYNELNKIELDFKNGTTCTYGIRKVSNDNIQDFNTDRVKVKVEQIKLTTSDQPNGSSPSECLKIEPSCPYNSYVKYTHTTVNKFKLGSIYHKKVEVKAIKETEARSNNGQAITIQSTQNLVSVYYWINDTARTYPLLIGIGKQNERAGSTDQGEIDAYYKLINKTENDYKWKQLSQDEKNGLPGTDKTKLLNLLDKINYEIKRVIKILIDQQTGYELYVSQQPGQTQNYTKERDKKIQVSECSENGCSKLKSSGYVCYVHNISNIAGDGFDYNTIGGIKFFITGKDNDVEIPLQGDDEKKMEHIPYNKCMADVYVYFYSKKDGSTDTVPLMLRYNGSYYRPEDRDQYFNEWSYQPAFEKFKTPCGSETEDESKADDYTIVATILDVTNKELNRIYLTESNNYGIPTDKPPPAKELNIDLTRVNVTIIPSKTEPSKPYVKLVHRTTNGFGFKEIWYRDRELVASNGINLNGIIGEASIKIETGVVRDNHTVFLENNSPNTVIAYYSIGDIEYKLPQVILLMTTEKPIGQGQEPITSKDGTTYGYYVLCTVKGSTGYKYEWRRPYDEDSSKPLTLDDETEFKLLNAVVIMIDKQSPYDESAIKSAITSAKIRSPGNESGVNRLTGKNINVAEETLNGGTSYGRSGECVSKYGYKLYTHDITALVQSSSPTIPASLPLIGGFRFLIPSSDNATGYHEISLYKDEGAKEPSERLYHSPTGTPNNSSQNKVYIFFYGSDPRPLLLCYQGNAYKPKKQSDPIPERQVMVDYTSWTRVTNITECTCLDPNLSYNDDNILNTLLEVVCFLNPVQINPTQIPEEAKTQITKEPPESLTSKQLTYKLHTYNTSTIINLGISRDKLSCYRKFTYQPHGTNGTSSSGIRAEGFRLGNVFHAKSKQSNVHSHLEYSKLRTTFPYDPVVGVSVYYYDHDEQYDEPLLIELDFKVSGGAATHKEYYKLIKADGTGTVDWEFDSDASGKIGRDNNQNIVNYLDIIRYNFKNVLQIKIAIKQKGKYTANLLDRNTRDPLTSVKELQVEVSEENNCQSLTGTGFRCFKHCISTLGPENLHKIGALQFLIPGQDRNQVDLNLYDISTKNVINPLYYNCAMGDIYVYFYGGNSNSGDSHIVGDPRPLLLCYNNKGYKAWNMDSYDSHMWYKSSTITNCPCKTTDDELLKDLASVSNLLNPVKIKKTTEDTYNIHKFNGEDIKIKITVKQSQTKFCYIGYTHTHVKNGFRLGNIEYNNQCIQDESNLCVCISSVLDEPTNKYIPASEVVVYYYQGDKSHKNPLLVALCKKNNGVHNGSTTTCQSKQYYELQRSAGTTKKIYKKGDNTIKLEEFPGSDLEKILDRILFNISKRLQIILDKNLEPIPLCPIERKRIKLPETKKPFNELGYDQIGLQLLNDAVVISTHMSQAITETILSSKNPKSYAYMIEKNCEKRTNEQYDPKLTELTQSYKARVYGSDGTQDPWPSGTTQIKVQKIDCKDLLDKGYRCYRHVLTTIEGIDDFGGLRLFLWDNRGTDEQDKSLDDCKITEPIIQDTKKQYCEIKLYEKCNQTGASSSDLPIEPIAYTTCKGDLYVYFYGSDPRPLLLCYNGDAYKPSDLNTYITLLR